MTDADKLLYEKSNTYRLHSDKTRWMLLGGYAAFFGVTIEMAKTPAYGIFFFFVAIIYLMVLGVQNWFYNLFALYVTECEHRIVNDKRLRPLEEFAQANGSRVNPFHPAFFFAMMVVVASAVTFLTVSMNLGTGISAVLAVGIYGAVLLCFKHWDVVIYRPLIRRFSNLFRQGEDGAALK